MKKSPLFALLTLVLWAGSAADAAPITYEVLIASGANTLSGSITTDGSLGVITGSNIVGWTFTTAGLPSFMIASTDPGAVTTCHIDIGCFWATETELQANTFPVSTMFEARLGAQWVGAISNPMPHYVNVGWSDGVALASVVVADPPTFGASGADMQVVPEPATVQLVAIGLAAGISVARRRRARIG